MTHRIAQNRPCETFERTHATMVSPIMVSPASKVYKYSIIYLAGDTMTGDTTYSQNPTLKNKKYSKSVDHNDYYSKVQSVEIQ